MTPSTFDLARLDTVHVVPPTPFTSDGKELLLDPLLRLAGDLAEAGMRVFLPAAGTGEFHSLTASEVLACVAAVRRAVPASAVVMAPVGMALEHALAIARKAAEAGADALLLMPLVQPYLSDAGYKDYFETVANASPLPLLAYKRAGVPSPRLLAELAAGGRLVGVKYAVNELDEFARFADEHGGRLGLYCGTAERFAPYFMLAGARGYTSGAGNLCPRLTLAMHAALTRGNYGAAMKLLRQIRPIEDYRAREGDSYNISMLKCALSLRGYAFGPPRPPQRQITAAEREEIAGVVAAVCEAEAALGHRAS
ncbi:MAG: dihydrodipicolinate synthase family protein [Pirellulales bacterium]|nr:dihydrodipicolinate synthase family protein [Pirellulales bacterium]